MKSIELSENHRRSISITLQLVDQALAEWNDWCAAKLRAGVMYEQLDTLSEIQKRDLRCKIDSVRKLIVKLRGDLDLEPKIVRTGNSIATHASLLWEMLTELNDRGLGAYGTVPDELKRYLDPIGQKLTEEMSAISGLFSEPTKSPLQA